MQRLDLLQITTGNKLNVVSILRTWFVNITFQSGIQSATRVCLHLIRSNLSKYNNIMRCTSYISWMENLFEGHDRFNFSNLIDENTFLRHSEK